MLHVSDTKHLCYFYLSVFVVSICFSTKEKCHFFLSFFFVVVAVSSHRSASFLRLTPAVLSVALDNLASRVMRAGE